MGNSQNVIKTNQDLAMMIAIKQLLDKSVHRFCMWHLKKVSKEVGVKLFTSPSFRIIFNHAFRNLRGLRMLRPNGPLL